MCSRDFSAPRFKLTWRRNIEPNEEYVFIFHLIDTDYTRKFREASLIHEKIDLISEAMSKNPNLGIRDGTIVRFEELE